MKEVQTQNF